MMRVLLCMVLVFVAGCTTAPRVITKTVEVKVPVPVPCRIAPIDKPVFALDRLSTADDLYSKGRAALVELDERRAYEVVLEAAVKSCQ